MSITTGLTITILLLALNAFFVAGEFAVTSARRSQIEPLAERGVRGAATALWAMEHVSLLLAICQLGITVASTSLGVVAEPAIAHLVEQPLVDLGLPGSTSHLVGFTVALIIVLYLHVVFGEMVPKNLSVSMPDKAILWLAPPLMAIGKVLKPIILALDKTANWFIRRLGFEPRSEVAATFTVEEVASIVQLSQAEGTLDDDLGLLAGSLEFSEESVGDTMVPIAKVVTLTEGFTPADVERAVTRTGFSRYPVVRATVAEHQESEADTDGELADGVTNEEIELLGYIHIKDILHAKGERRFQAVENWRVRDLPQVNPEAEVEDALREMQRLGTHLAEVIDGSGVIGILFLEDVIEELIGEVRDSLQREDLTTQ